MSKHLANETQILVLSILDAQPRLYGLQIVAASGGQIKRGSVYELLLSLQNRELVIRHDDPMAGHPGPPRPSYTLSERGQRMLSAWRSFNEAPPDR